MSAGGKGNSGLYGPAGYGSLKRVTPDRSLLSCGVQRAPRYFATPMLKKPKPQLLTPVAGGDKALGRVVTLSSSQLAPPLRGGLAACAPHQPPTRSQSHSALSQPVAAPAASSSYMGAGGLVSFVNGFIEDDSLSSPSEVLLQGGTANGAAMERPRSILRIDPQLEGDLSESTIMGERRTAGQAQSTLGSSSGGKASLRRVLPDKLDWTHQAFQRLWIQPHSFPFGGISSHQLMALSRKSSEYNLADAPGSPGSPPSQKSPKNADTVSANNPSLATSTSVPVLAAIHAMGFEPGLERSARSMRDIHNITPNIRFHRDQYERGAASDAGVNGAGSRGSLGGSSLPQGNLAPMPAFDPPPPSSLALPKSGKAVMRDKHAFAGRSV